MCKSWLIGITFRYLYHFWIIRSGILPPAWHELEGPVYHFSQHVVVVVVSKRLIRLNVASYEKGKKNEARALANINNYVRYDYGSWLHFTICARGQKEGRKWRKKKRIFKPVHPVLKGHAARPVLTHSPPFFSFLVFFFLFVTIELKRKRCTYNCLVGLLPFSHYTRHARSWLQLGTSRRQWQYDRHEMKSFGKNYTRSHFNFRWRSRRILNIRDTHRWKIQQSVIDRLPVVAKLLVIDNKREFRQMKCSRQQ